MRRRKNDALEMTDIAYVPARQPLTGYRGARALRLRSPE
jgi:hypothetical protein